MVSRDLIRRVEEGQKVIEHKPSVVKAMLLRRSISEIAYLRQNNYEVEEFEMGAYIARKIQKYDN